ncbi:AAA family ATPase [Candidatus Poribacteria bacterium]|nr:AAA family ATPase [Candidatus Poribacteria bacterium]
MSEQKVFLEQINIKNFLSLRNVTLSLKPLTVLVGPNASGKSNILSALNLLNTMTIAENPPPPKFIQDRLWAGKENNVFFQLHTKVETTSAEYRLEISSKSDNPIVAEELLVKDQKNVQAIFIENGEGTVQDEDGSNKTNYKSNKLALKSAGDYGNKPITRTLTEFIKGWEFYDFQPGYRRGGVTRLTEILSGESEAFPESPKLDDDGSTLPILLSYWYENDRQRFNKVSESLQRCTNIRIDFCVLDGDRQLCLSEGYERPILLKRASDGTLRLVAYYILLNEPELPSLIAIEEPERNLHPGALTDIANVLEQLAERTQVIITTHSSQLLDTFSSNNLSDWLGVLLLRNPLGHGTEVINVEEIRRNRKGLDGWIIDFGVGSAIFDSGLLQDLMEEPV